jgi:hypothetical protein
VGSFKIREIQSALGRKGFQIKGQKKHEMWIYYINGKKTSIYTFLSHGSSEYNDNRLGSMAKEMHIPRNMLDEFIQCSLSQKEYENYLVDKGLITI